MPVPVERWCKVVGFEDYEISSHGRLRSWKPYRNGSPKPSEPRICKLGTDKDGYLRTTIYNNRVRKLVKIAALVLLTFRGPSYPPKDKALHHNGDNKDNRLSNLYWGSTKQNSDDSRRHGTLVNGTRVNTCKLTEEDVRFIRQSTESHAALARRFGTTPGAVWHIRAGRTWKHVR